MNQLEDRFLISAYISGDEKAFETLVLRHKDRIYRTILMKVKNPALAQDMFQEVFIKIINTMKLGNYNEEGKFLPWALRIANNLVIDYFRRNKKIKLISESSSKKDDYNIFHTLAFDESNQEEKMTYDELVSQMLDVLDLLPESQREIVKMRLFQELSFKDISELEDISINTALGRMRYALINMRKIIKEKDLVVDI